MNNWYNNSRYRWDNIDWWNKPNWEIHLELGASNTQIAEMRKLLAPDTRLKYPDWSNTDWSKSNEEIAKEKGVVVKTVENKRRMWASESIPDRGDDVWEKVTDWNRSNEEIALETKRSIAQVAKVRPFYAPETVDEKYRHKGIDWNTVGPNIDWTRQNSDIANEFHIGIPAVSQQRNMYDPKRATERNEQKKRKYDWKNVDWGKSNGEIATKLVEDMVREYSLSPSEISERQIEKLKNYVSRQRNYIVRNKKQEDSLIDQNIVMACLNIYNWYRRSC